MDKSIEHLSDKRFVFEQLAKKTVIDRLAGNALDPFEGVKAAHLSKLGVSAEFSTKAFDAGMIEDDAGK